MVTIDVRSIIFPEVADWNVEWRSLGVGLSNSEQVPVYFDIYIIFKHIE